VILHVEGERVYTSDSLAAVARPLDPERFLRVSRRAVVNFDYVELLQPNEVGGYTARLRGGARVEVSRQAARRLRRMLGLAGG